MLIIAAIVVSLRLPGYFFIEVVKLPNCDFFESRILSVKDRDPELTRMYRISDVFIQVRYVRQRLRHGVFKGQSVFRRISVSSSLRLLLDSLRVELCCRAEATHFSSTSQKAVHVSYDIPRG